MTDDLMKRVREALEPFADMERTLREWRDEGGLVQSKVPDSALLLYRECPVEGETGLIEQHKLYPHHFRAAREVLSLIQSAQGWQGIENVTCKHEPYQGRCVHCDVPFVNGLPAPPSKGQGND